MKSVGKRMLLCFTVVCSLVNRIQGDGRRQNVLGDEKSSGATTTATNFNQSTDRYFMMSDGPISTNIISKFIDNTTEIPMLSYDLNTTKECENFARDFAYQQNLCDAPDPESYTVAALGRLTCKHRCGVAPTFGRLWSECGCDELCVVLSYCCRDMASQCPDHYKKAEEMRDYVQEKRLFLQCSRDTVVFQPLYASEERTSFTELFSSTAGFHDVDTTRKMSTDGFEDMTLREIVSDVRYHRVADLSKGIVFNNYHHFIIGSEPTASPNFIPIVAGLECPGMPLPRVQYVSIAHVLRWCSTTVTWHMRTKLERDCYKDVTVACKCRDRAVINKHLHDVCLAGNHPSQLQVKATPGLQIFLRQVALHFFNFECKTFNRWFVKEQPKVSQNAEFYFSTSLCTSDTFANIFPQSTGFKDWNDRSARRFSLSEHQAMGYRDIVEKYYESTAIVVESNQVLETRLICPGRNSLLSDCHLAGCAPGAVLSTRPLAPWKFGGRSCEVPKLAVVSSIQHKLPVCVCIRSLLALESLQLWTAIIKRSEEGQCMIGLDVLPVHDTKKPKTFYTFPDDSSHLTTEPSTLDDLKDRILTPLVTTETICNERFNIEDIRICFYVSQTEVDTVRDAIDCLHLDTESASEKHNAWIWTAVAAGLITLISV